MMTWNSSKIKSMRFWSPSQRSQHMVWCSISFAAQSIHRALFLFHKFTNLILNTELRNWWLQEQEGLVFCELPPPFLAHTADPAPDVPAVPSCCCLRRLHWTGCITVLWHDLVRVAWHCFDAWPVQNSKKLKLVWLWELLTAAHGGVAICHL